MSAVLNFPQPVQSPQPTIRTHIKTLAERGVLVRLRRRQWSPYCFDKHTTAEVNAQAGIVKKVRVNKLLMTEAPYFKKMMAANNQPYIYLMANTRPWLDDGLRLLNIELYIDFTAALRRKISEAAAEVTYYCATHWDTERDYDIQALKGLADAGDYPADLQAEYSTRLNFLPVPSVGDFRLGAIGQDDMQSLADELHEAERVAATSVIRDMLDPLQYAIARLTEYTGGKGQRWHESVLTNLVEVAHRMEKVNLSDDPAIMAAIQQMKQLAVSVSMNSSAVKEDQSTRDAVKNRITTLAGQFAGLV